MAKPVNLALNVAATPHITNVPISTQTIQPVISQSQHMTGNMSSLIPSNLTASLKVPSLAQSVLASASSTNSSRSQSPASVSMLSRLNQIDSHEDTIKKLKSAQLKQDNQEKLDYESFKQEVDDELDDFPIVLDNNNGTSTFTIDTTDKNKLAKQSRQRAKNQELLNDIIINDELDEERQQQKQSLGVEMKVSSVFPEKDAAAIYQLSEVENDKSAKQEESMSISEIISNRFKNKVRVNKAETPEQTSRFIKTPDHANSDFDNNWYVSFLEEKRAQPLRNGAISKLFQHVYRHFPSNSELSKTSQLLANNLKNKLTNAGNMILAQTKSSSKSQAQAEQKSGTPSRKDAVNLSSAAGNQQIKGDSRRNIVLLVMVLVQTAICCFFTKAVFVPISAEAAYEINYRVNQQDRGKTYIMRDPIVNIFMVKRIQEKQDQKAADKKNSKKVKRIGAGSQAPGSNIYESGVSGTMRSGFEATSNQSGGSHGTGRESHASKAGDAEQGSSVRPGSGVGAKISSRAKQKRKKPRKDNPHLKQKAANE